jgi:outer membrane protein assembly factor BamD
MKQRVVFLLTIAIYLLLSILLLTGCSRQRVVQDLSAEERFQRGMRFYEENNFTRAIDEFRVLTRQFAGSELADDAQYHLAMSYFNLGEFILAANEFETLVNTMSASPLLPDAQFKLASSFYNLSPRHDLDQQYTLNAIDELQTFIDFFPTNERVPEAEAKIRELNEKIAKKQYENARTYMRMRYYRAATRYFELVIDRYHDTQYAELSFIGKIEALIEREQFDEAQETLQRFLRQFPNSNQRERARILERRIASSISDQENNGDNENAASRSEENIVSSEDKE